MNLNEIAYIEKIKNGDQDGLDALMRIYLKLVSYIVSNILGKSAADQDVEECVSNVFIYLWENAEKYNSTRGSVKTWIVMCSRYKALDFKKKYVKEFNLVGIEEIKEILSDDYIEEYVIAKELSEFILKTIDGFNETDKNAFYYRYFLHIEICEIASILGISREVLDNRLWRCRKKLKEILDNENQKGVR